MRYTEDQLYNLSMPVYDLDGNLLPDPKVVSKAIGEAQRTHHLYDAWEAYTCLSRRKPTSDTVPYRHNHVDSVIKTPCEDLLRKIMFAYARVYSIPWISLNPSNLIAPRSSKKVKDDYFTRPFERFAWEIARRMNIGAGCGNGLGDHIYQYQIKGSLFFSFESFGIWDPKKETRIFDESLDMDLSRTFTEKLEKVSDKGSDAVAKFFESEYNDRVFTRRKT